MPHDGMRQTQPITSAGVGSAFAANRVFLSKSTGSRWSGLNRYYLNVLLEASPALIEPVQSIKNLAVFGRPHDRHLSGRSGIRRQRAHSPGRLSARLPDFGG